jgi:carotenoid 1,2-hydratase
MNAATDSLQHLRAAPRSTASAFPRFDAPVPDGGYRWWYIDALSDDGRHGLTLIVFIGSVFSPFYAAARRAGPTPAAHFPAVNVALYGPGRRWALCERGTAALATSTDHLSIGPSSLGWNGSTLCAHLDERAAPLPWRIRGRVLVHPEALTGDEIPLDLGGRHRWWPFAPSCRVEVDQDRPRHHMQGRGDVDTNRGSEPLENAFRGWNWSRAAASAGTRIHYDVQDVDGARRELALLVRPAGTVEVVRGAPRAGLPKTPVWRIARETRADDSRARIDRTLEDTPFYARSLVAARQGGEDVLAVHESLDLGRFTSRWVQRLIPYRMRVER